ncbi:MAG TPA: universal stress protein [Acidimicrobiales bacterium]|nr:universal stress protein [Acidimicrobiales bacterium]
MFKTIVVGTDGSPTAADAVRATGKLAQLSGATVHVVTAYRPTSELFFHPEFAALPADVHEQIDPAGGARQTAEHGVGMLGASVTGEAHARPGAPADVLCDVAADVSADLIVVGNRGMTGARRMLGSVPNSVTHHAPCAVLIVPTS